MILLLLLLLPPPLLKTAISAAPSACLDAEKHRPDLKRGRPLVLQYVEADAPELINIGVVDLRQETNLLVTTGQKSNH